MGENWGGDIVMDFAASPNSDSTVCIEGASVWYQFDDSFRLDIGQLKVPFGMEETTSSSKLKAIERSAVNRQFAETIKFNARHTGLFAKGSLDNGFSYNLALVNSGQNHNSKDSGLKTVFMNITTTNCLTTEDLDTLIMTAIYGIVSELLQVLWKLKNP